MTAVPKFYYPPGVHIDAHRYAFVSRMQARLIEEHNHDRGLSPGKRRGYVRNWRGRLLGPNRELCRLRAVLFEPVETPDGVVPPAWSAKMNGRATRSLDVLMAGHPCLTVPDDFRALPVVDPPEDYTTYVEVDVGANRVVVDSATQLTVTNLDEDENVWVYRDCGLDHFDGDFEHLVDHKLTAAGPGWGACCSWALSDTVDSPRAAGNGVHVRFGSDGGAGNHATLLQHYEAGVQQDSDTTGGGLLGLNTWNYLTIPRVGSALSCEIYDAATRINPGDLVDILVIDDDLDPRQHALAMCSYVVPNAGRSMSTVIANLDLQEFVPWPYPLHDLTGGLRQ